MIRSLRVFTLMAALLSVAFLTGCAQLRLGVPVPSIDNIQKARGSGISPVAVGDFALAPGKDAGLDQKVSARTNSIFSPFDNSFAKYLKENLSTDLRAAGLLDPGSKILVTGRLVDSQLDVPVGKSKASVAARFTVTKAGAQVYDKELRADREWQSEFLGVIAVQAAMNEYAGLYRKLVADLLDDPAFRAAARN